ncbi:hypothetical protein [Agromyces sp. NPDC058104]|uniref:hypothetical protein n=1 Tax=Agromyces sp. NPDC058104 TaxID=3346342 RepID=UPI0036DD1726
MTELRTPEQIVDDVYWTLSGFPTEPSGPDLRALMVRAIEADRAQRLDVADAVANFDKAITWDAADDIAEHLNFGEAEAMARVFTAAGKPDRAHDILTAWAEAEGDYDADDPEFAEHAATIAEYAKAAGRPWTEAAGR